MQEETPGAYVALNKDDDNGNQVPDKDDTGTVQGENDLVPLHLKQLAPDELTGTVTLTRQPAYYVKVWQSATKGSEVPFSPTTDSVDFEASELPKTLYVEGRNVTGPQGTWLELSYSIAGATARDRVVCHVVDVQVDLDIEDVDEEHEENPGGFLAAEGFVKLPADVVPDAIGPVKLDVTSGEERILLWDDQWQPLEAHVEWATGADVPPYLWAAGIVPSDAPRDVTVELAHSTAKDIVNLTVVELNLKSVTFGPDPNANPVNYHDVAYDATGAPYPTPQWLDSNGDGDANDQGDNWSPVCYIRNTKMMVTVTVMLAPAAAFGEVVKIKGDGPGNLDFPETVATVQNDEATISGVVCDNPFPEVVHWYYDDGLEITWTLSRDGGGTWVGAPMKSKNEAFITLEQPACAARFRTVLYLATCNGGVSYGGCVANTWSNFSTGTGPMNVDAWDDAERAYTRPLHYYLHSWDGPGSAADLLALGTGQCGSWADLLNECFLANNTPNTHITLVTPPETPPEDYQTFGVQNISFDDVNPDYPEDAPWKYSTDDLDTTAAGKPGQNMATPQAKLFGLHYIVHCGGTNYYDPSYGFTATGAEDYTPKAVAAWGQMRLGALHWRQRTTEPTVYLNLLDQ